MSNPLFDWSASICSVLANPIESVYKSRMILCRESERPATGVVLDIQQAVGVSCHLQAAVLKNTLVAWIAWLLRPRGSRRGGLWTTVSIPHHFR
jgi:hypothetical protein